MAATPTTVNQRSQSSSGQFVAVTASATAFSGGICRGLYLGTAGDVTITDYANNSVTFTNLAAGVIHPIQARAVTTLANGAAGAIIAY